MKILGIVGSNRKDGNSYLLLKEILCDKPSIETKIVQIAELKLRPCMHCWELCSQKPFECVLDDDFKVLFEEMRNADRIVIVCPLYFYIPSKFQVIMERFACLVYYTAEKHSKEFYPLAGKPCALIAISGAGGYNTLEVLNHLERFALFLHMRPVITNFWPYIGVTAKGGDEKGEVLKDQKGIKRSKELIELLVKEVKRGK